MCLCQRLEHWMDCLQLFQALALRRLQPNELVYSAAMGAMTVCGRWHQSVMLWGRAKSENSVDMILRSSVTWWFQALVVFFQEKCRNSIEIFCLETCTKISPRCFF